MSLIVCCNISYLECTGHETDCVCSISYLGCTGHEPDCVFVALVIYDALGMNLIVCL